MKRQTDTGWAWVVLAGGVAVFFIVGSVFNTFGIFFVEFVQEFDSMASSTSLIVAVRSGCEIFTAVLAPHLCDRFTERRVMAAGGLLISLSFMATFFASSLGYLIVTLGAAYGVSVCLVMIATKVTVTKYFKRRRSLAHCLTMCGASLGLVIISPIATISIFELGFRGTFLILGASALHLVAIAMVFRPIQGEIISSMWNNHTDQDNCTQTIISPVSVHQEYSQNDAENKQGSQDNVCIRKDAKHPLIYAGITKDPASDFTVEYVNPIKQTGPYPLDRIQCHQGIEYPNIDQTKTGSILSDRLQNINTPDNVEASNDGDPQSTNQDNPDTNCLNDQVNGKLLVSEDAEAIGKLASNDIVTMDDSRSGSINVANEGERTGEAKTTSVRYTLATIKNGFHKQCLLIDNLDNDNDQSSDHKQTEQKTCINRTLACIGDFFSIEVLKSHIVQMVLISVFLFFSSLLSQRLFLVPRAEERGVSKLDAAMLLSISGGCDIVGRLVSGVLSNLNGVRPHHVACIASVIAGTASCLFPLADSFSSMVVYASVFGLTGSVGHVLSVPLVMHLSGEDNMSRKISLLQLTQGVCGVIAPPFLGWVKDLTGDFDVSFYISGSMMVVGGLLLLSEALIRRIERTKYQKH